MGLSFGLASIVKPQPYALQFGLFPNHPFYLSASRNPFIPVAGGRAVATGLTTLVLLACGYEKAVGVMFLCGSVMGIVDGACVVHYGMDGCGGLEESENEGKAMEQREKELWAKAWQHFGTVGFAGAVGAWMWKNCTN